MLTCENFPDTFSPNSRGRRLLVELVKQRGNAGATEGIFKQVKQALEERYAPGSKTPQEIASQKKARKEALSVWIDAHRAVLDQDYRFADIRNLATWCASAKELSIPPGLLRDLAVELWETEFNGTGPKWVSSDASVACGRLVEAVDSAAVLVLLSLNDGKSGGLGRLVVECVPNGHGDCYPVPALFSEERDALWENGFANARNWLENQGLWPTNADVRWRLEQVDGEWSGITGDSASFAFLVAAGSLLVRHKPETDRRELAKLLADLGAVELGSMASSAAVTSSLDLKTVGNLDVKLGGEIFAHVAFRPIRTLLVAEGQNEAFLEPFRKNAPGLPPVILVKAATVDEGIRLLHRETGPRRAVRDWVRRTLGEMEGVGHDPVPFLEPQTSCSPETETASLFQVLPLLQKIQVKELPQEKSGPRGEGKEDDEKDRQDRRKPGRVRENEVIRWEEQQRGRERVEFLPVSLDALFSDFKAILAKAQDDAAKGPTPPEPILPRFVLLGPPGSGKTTLLQYVAWLAAGETWQPGGRAYVPVRIRLREWEAWSGKIADPDPSLPSYLYALHKDLEDAPSVEQWRRWLKQGDVLLLLDGLDEIDGMVSFVAAVKAALVMTAACPVVLSCRTVSYESYQAYCPGFPVFLTGALSVDQHAAYIRRYPAKEGRKFDREKLIEQLRANHSLRLFACLPLLLSFICLVVDEPNGIALPATRTELLDKVIDKLLDHKLAGRKRVETKCTLSKDRKRCLLRRAAFDLFHQADDDRRQLVFSGQEVERCLTEAAKQEGYLSNASDIADALLDDLVVNSGLLRRNSSGEFHFLHLSIQEFLAADALAAIVAGPNGKGWETKLSDVSATVLQFASAKAWDPRWQEVVCYLAGRAGMLGVKANSAAPWPLIEMLTDEKTDDLQRSRLAMAGRCLVEIPRAMLEKEENRSWCDETATMIFCRWLWMRERKVEALNPDFGEVVGALMQAGACICVEEKRLKELAERVALPRSLANTMVSHPLSQIQELPVLLRAGGVRSSPRKGIVSMSEFLARLLRDSDENVQYIAASYVGGLGAAAAMPKILDELAELLRHRQLEVRVKTADALGALGAGAAIPKVLGGLADLLTHPTYLARHSATGAVRKLGAAAAMPEFLRSLVSLMGDCERDAYGCAAWCLGQLGPSAAVPEILDAIAVLLNNADSATWQRAAVVGAIGKLGPKAAVPKILQILTGLLNDPENYIRCSAVEALGGLSPADPKTEFVHAMAALLHDPAPEVRSAAAGVVGKLGAVAITPEILRTLPELLRDSNQEVRSASASLAGRLSGIAASAILPSLLESLSDQSGEVRSNAASAICNFGNAAVTEEVVATLRGLLLDPDREIASNAVEVICRLGISLEFIEFLETSLRDSDRFVRMRAAIAAGLFGQLAATPKILKNLAAMMRAPDQGFRHSAVEALGKIGRAAAKPDIIEAFPELLWHLDGRNLRSKAAEALGNFGVAAATPEILAALDRLMTDAIDSAYTDRGDASQEYDAALAAVCKLAAAAGTPEFLAAVASAVRDDAETALSALLDISEFIGNQGVFTALEGQLCHEKAHIRRMAARVLANMLEQSGQRLISEEPGHWKATAVARLARIERH